MAAVVASTLRRRTMQQKQYQADAKYQTSDPEQVALTRTPTKTSSSYRLQSGRSPQHGEGVKGTKVLFEDFWPSLLSTSDTTNIRSVKFEQFDTLIPKANAWLQDNLEVELIKCETVEKKIGDLDQLTSDSTMFTPGANPALYIKGLRLWYMQCSRDTNKLRLQNPMPLAIGYLNVVPKCLESKSKYPIYEDLPETYASVNTYMADKPLEGKILTIETVSLKLPCKQWQGPEVDPDMTCTIDELVHHIFYITRIYFLFGKPEAELIGAQDFLPDFEQSSRLNRTCSVFPKYRPLANAMNKVAEWLHNARNIHVTNIQTVETVFRNLPENVHTGITFMKRVDSCVTVRFVRITYTRRRVPPATAQEATPAEDSAADAAAVPISVTVEEPDSNADEMYTTPAGFSYKTFIPAAVKVGMCSGSPEYETFKPMWERSKAWLLCSEKKVVSVESLYHPINSLWHSQDGGETSAVCTNWAHSIHGTRHRQQLVQIVRVYMDGDYQEPSSDDLPMLPMVEEVNDCRCTVM